MADLIDRAALLEQLELLAKHEDPFRETVIRGVMFTISNETAVDAVEVVRCKDCDWHREEDGGICVNSHCTKSYYGCRVRPEHFCSFGERKET